jgi:hypothetical protein
MGSAACSPPPARSSCRTSRREKFTRIKAPPADICVASISHALTNNFGQTDFLIGKVDPRQPQIESIRTFCAFCRESAAKFRFGCRCRKTGSGYERRGPTKNKPAKNKPAKNKKETHSNLPKALKYGRNLKDRLYFVIFKAPCEAQNLRFVERRCAFTIERTAARWQAPAQPMVQAPPTRTTEQMAPIFLFSSPPRKRGSRAAEEVLAALDTRFRGHDGKRAGSKCQTRTTTSIPACTRFKREYSSCAAPRRSRCRVRKSRSVTLSAACSPPPARSSCQTRCEGPTARGRSAFIAVYLTGAG